ncbi:MAG: hypothetical protein GC185_00435 [Alphaproteobacteria bacterium]|nr:hypothetical protein [Alphaproteobacteria bacterium]
MAKKLYVRFSTAQDEQKIFDYYTENEHEFVAKRDPEIWKERISSGAVTLIEDEQGKIVASSISYPLMTKDADGNDAHTWSEIGSVRVTLDGIGLFKTLMAAHVMRSYMLEPPDDRFAIEIVIGNEHSKHVFLKEGATPWQIPDELRKLVEDTMSPDDDTGAVEWFQLGVEAMPHFAQQLLKQEANPKLVNKKTGEEYELDFSKCVLTTTLRDQLEKLSGLDFGDKAKPQMKHGLKKFRDKFNP